MKNLKPFKGSSVFMSRKLVPPEIFDALRDALNHGGAMVFLCADPSRSGPDDFHIIASPDHEKFEDLRAKGCNLLGPQCVFSCAKEHRALPKQGYTCCLAMDGVKILASGFDADEKGKIEKLVAAMGGLLVAKTSTDVSFVIVKNVLAAKYKWALHVLKKPMVGAEWLYQCWNEHRIVPQESFRVLPFTGLTICVTRVPADERMEMAKVIMQNGGKYSAELNKKCTHLISDPLKATNIRLPKDGATFILLPGNGLINLSSEEGGFVSSNKGVRGGLKTQLSQGKAIYNLQSIPSSMATDTNSLVVPSAEFMDPEMEATLSQSTSSTVPVAPIYVKEEGVEPVVHPQNEINSTNLDGCIADDSQSEDNDLYFSECRILIVGFEASDMRRLVNMVCRGGGSRHVQPNDKLTHIIVGNPSENEKKEVRSLASSGIIHVVRTTWLEECDRLKKEIPVNPRHIAQDLLLPKGALTGVSGVNQGRISIVQSSVQSDCQLPGTTNAGTGRLSSLEKNRKDKEEINTRRFNPMPREVKPPQQSQLPVVNDTHKGLEEEKKQAPKSSQRDSSTQTGMCSDVFKGKVFDFSSSFPEDRKGEVVQWIKQGQGEVLDIFLKQGAQFTIECHGELLKSVYGSKTIYVSSHWIRSCLEDGNLLEVNSHILYSPLPCRIPFPGFEKFRFCVSQYEEKDRKLLRNLCFVLGAKLIEKLTKKVTHLLCKFAIGPKYEAACQWGIHSITSEWIYECVKQNKLVPLNLFPPKVVTTEDQEAGLCTTSQFPTQARMISRDNPTQFSNRLEDSGTALTGVLDSRNSSLGEGTKTTSKLSKKARLLEDEFQRSFVSTEVHLSAPASTGNSSGENIIDNVPDVASAIEDLLEQTSKIHDQKSPGRASLDDTIFPSNRSTLGQDHVDTHSFVGLSNHWLHRTGKRDDSSGDGKLGLYYDGFSETQTDSQVVGYEEDLSGRQMLIDKVRTRSSMI